MALTLDGTNGIVSSGSITTQSATGVIFSDSSSLPAASSPFGLKNRLINGDMTIDQRNAGAAITPTGAAFPVDRWGFYMSQASKFTVQQNRNSITPPAGFTNYLGFTVASAVSIGAGDYFTLEQAIEGFNVADLGWGTANAQTVTLSFWVRSSLTGTFGGSLYNAAGNYSYAFNYTISAANTWERKTITITGPTTGAFSTNNTSSFSVVYSLGVGSTYSGTAGTWAVSNLRNATGSVSVVGTAGATFYITGVQLERNTTATPFEWLPYTTELQLCQRYYENYAGSFYMPVVGGNALAASPFKVSKRSAPTVTYTSTGGSVSATGSTIQAITFTLYGGTVISIDTWIANSEL
jgi:hypothetical protein